MRGHTRPHEAETEREREKKVCVLTTGNTAQLGAKVWATLTQMLLRGGRERHL